MHSVIPHSTTLLQNKSKWSRLCRHSRLSHCVKRWCQRCICCSHISEDTRKRLSVDFICLFGSLPDCWSVHCEGSVGAHAADKPNPPLASPKQTCIYSMFVAFHSAHTHTHLILQCNKHRKSLLVLNKPTIMNRII